MCRVMILYVGEKYMRITSDKKNKTILKINFSTGKKEN